MTLFITIKLASFISRLMIVRKLLNYFRRAYAESPADAYYKQAALKLAEKLSR